MRVLVVGGAGYIGSHTARELSRHGHEIRVFDNLSTGRRELARQFELVIGDIRDYKEISAAVEGMDAVLHFAAHAYVGESVTNPQRYFDNNVRGGLNLLDAVLEAGIKKFVFSSSCAVYGIPPRLPITEDSPREPVNPYGASKLSFEHALSAYDRAYGLRYVSLRYFNAAGADEDGDIGEMHSPETHIIPAALEAAAGIRSELQVYGHLLPTADGTCIRDYVHVNDLAVAHRLALQHMVGGKPSDVFNLGTGRGHSIREILSTVEKVSGQKVPTKYCEPREGDPHALVADPSKAHRVLNWRATRSLDDIVRTAWRWTNGQAYQAFNSSKKSISIT